LTSYGYDVARKDDKPTVHLVTEARSSRYDDIAARQRQYLIRMFIRTVAVMCAFFVPMPIWGRVLAITLGLVLPMISVTSANSGPLPEPRMHRFLPWQGRELPKGDTPAEPDDEPHTRAS
jgi:hypothetical protein